RALVQARHVEHEGVGDLAVQPHPVGEPPTEADDHLVLGPARDRRGPNGPGGGRPGELVPGGGGGGCGGDLIGRGPPGGRRRGSDGGRVTGESGASRSAGPSGVWTRAPMSNCKARSEPGGCARQNPNTPPMEVSRLLVFDWLSRVSGMTCIRGSRREANGGDQ